MYAVIGGAGEVGINIARALYNEGYNIAMIDRDRKACERAEALDALVVRGNAASIAKQEEAGVDSAELFIGVTGSDEINMVACGIAHLKGCKTIARINSLDYIDEPISTKKFALMGIDVAVCPELVAAIKMARMLTMPSLLDTDVFARGKIQIIESVVNEKSGIVGNMLKNIPLPPHCNVVAIFRKDDVIIPGGMDRLYAGDRIVVALGDPRGMPEIKNLFGVGGTSTPASSLDMIDKIMIVGATRIGMHLARLLEKEVSIVLIDEDEARCQKASERLLSSLVIHGGITDEEVLREEGIANVDAFIATTSSEEINILSCILAKQYGAKKTIALVDRPELKTTLEEIGIDIAVSPRIATVSGILQHVHRAEILSLSVLHGGEARIVELKVTPNSKVAGKPLKKIHFPSNTLVGAVVRGENVIIPGGEDLIRVGDSLIVFARTETIPKLVNMF
jgi:trk system potassium uptake protein TrkA